MKAEKVSTFPTRIEKILNFLCSIEPEKILHFLNSFKSRKKTLRQTLKMVEGMIILLVAILSRWRLRQQYYLDKALRIKVLSGLKPHFFSLFNFHTYPCLFQQSLFSSIQGFLRMASGFISLVLTRDRLLFEQVFLERIFAKFGIGIG